MVQNYELAYEDYRNGMKYKDIAGKYGVSLATVKSWKTRYKWQRGMCTKKEKVCIRNEKDMQPKSDEEVERKIIDAVGNNSELSDKQRLFCIYWIKNKNATLAAKKAGYAPESAHVEGSRLLRNPKIREYIELFISEIKNNVMIDASEIVEKYMQIAFADITDFVDFGLETVPVIIGGKLMTTKDAATGEAIPMLETVNAMRLKDSATVDGGIISEISQGKNGTKIKLESRHQALEWLSKYFMLNPMDKHKAEYDQQRLELEYERRNIENAKLDIYKQRISGRLDLETLIDGDNLEGLE